MRRLVMIGASGHGKVCAEIAKLNGIYDEIFFLDDDTSVQKCGIYEVVGSSKNIEGFIEDNTDFFVSIGNHVHRKRIQEFIEGKNANIATLIHPQAIVSEESSVGIGSVVMAGAVINPGAAIGNGVIVNTSASVDHDCVIGNWNHISVGSHICGTVTIGHECWIGAGAVVSNNIEICSSVVIGAGAVVVQNIKVSGTYIGVPARITDTNS